MAILDIESLPSEPEPVYASMGTLYNQDRLSGINENTPENEVYDILKRSYPNLISEEYVKGHTALVRKLFTQDKVLLMISKIVGELAAKKQLTYDQKVYMNKIIFSMIKNNVAKSEYQASLLNSISRQNNADIVSKLAQYVPEQVACTIAVLRYSSFKERTNIIRVNEYLLRAIANNDKAEQIIVGIYDVLYPRVTYLFEGIMLDVKDVALLPEDQKEIYGIQALAVLDIINDMPAEYIKQVLQTYYNDLALCFTNMPTRFNLSTINVSDYGRIVAVDRMLAMEHH